MNRVIRITGIVAGSLVGLIVLLGAGVYGASSSRINRIYQVTPAALAIPTDSASIANTHGFCGSNTRATGRIALVFVRE